MIEEHKSPTMNNIPQALKEFSSEQYSTAAIDIYEQICDLPIISPHGHCNAQWFAEDTSFADPAELLIIPDHYVFRMLYSQGIDLAELGIGVPQEQRDPRRIFKLFAANWHLFLGTPSRQWLAHTFRDVFALDQPLNADTADVYYDTIDAAIRSAEFKPRALFEQFNISLLATTDGATDALDAHTKLRSDSWSGRIIPTFRPDSVIDPLHPDFKPHLKALGEQTQCDCSTYKGYLDALRARREFFKSLGATATDHAISIMHTNWLSASAIDTLFQRVTSNNANEQECLQFHGHMLIEMALMSVDDGLVMQIHSGSRRNTNHALFDLYGTDMGADMPQPNPWLLGMEALLNVTGNNKKLSILLFSLDESCYARELAPMAGHWPCLKLGPPWWFYDSANGIQRYLDNVVETAGYYNLSGFNDDTRAFLSIPARHDVWRQGVSLHLANQLRCGATDKTQAFEIAKHLTCDAAISAYKLEDTINA